uniref:Putative secreted protein n=1 Tax=Amblyomma cajennense TaxID=34607 RepID=A0A023FDE4_AMBCJ
MGWRASGFVFHAVVASVTCVSPAVVHVLSYIECTVTGSRFLNNMASFCAWVFQRRFGCRQETINVGNVVRLCLE